MIKTTNIRYWNMFRTSSETCFVRHLKHVSYVIYLKHNRVDKKILPLCCIIESIVLNLLCIISFILSVISLHLYDKSEIYEISSGQIIYQTSYERYTMTIVCIRINFFHWIIYRYYLENRRKISCKNNEMNH